ncbi:tetratricopeptide repeat-containing sensor histidine kinase [Leeuwenhoekiella marinoflava]|uniref:histidine kinase n=2 Tax=Leeuwenhoekiella marinoflava TaxID=988 RepID=A0A4Q0PJ76_9FLAO|nr:tetratricopeptide repeat-containing sensor histidine kinase [Leeuwenhoekiella marinoflava]RXG27366.1 histidine kinase/DNA gyrase B/HSP90-like ATPase [Leeuwenhoekiella marinoflava]SHF71257.1 Histidine kinase-, DNA gyrase B-, and HSP90-like ATPase [Leeuwenhoekiella marinoflava DSM 3653]
MKHHYYWAFIIFLSIQTISAQKIQTIDSLNAILVQNSSLKTDSLIIIFENNLKDAQKIDYKKGIGEAYKNIATIYGYEANGEKRVEYNLKAIRVFEENDLKPQAANLYGEMGYGMKRDNMEKAQYYMNKGLKIAEAGNYKEVLDRTYNNYGVLKEMQGQLDSALYFYKKGLAIVENRNYTEGLPYSYSNLAGVYSQLGNYKLSREYFYKAKSIREEIKDRKGIAENYTQIGEVYLTEGKPKTAISFFKKSLPIARNEDYRFLMQYTYQQISEAFKRLNQTDSALYYFERYSVFKDSINSLETSKKIAALEVEYDTEQKENQILQQRAEIIEKDLQVRRKNLYIYGSLGFAFLLGLLGYLVYSRQKLKNDQLKKESELQVALAKIETQNRLEEQRLRISQDLHDNIGSQLTFIISSLDSLKFKLQNKDHKVTDKLTEISLFTAMTINELRDTIWAMNKNVITAEDLQTRISNFIGRAQNSKDSIQFNFEYENAGIPEFVFTSVEGVTIYRIIQEAVNNAVKYAGAKKIAISLLTGQKSSFKVEITDDGNGFDLNNYDSGFGISNMKKRANDINALLEIKSTQDSGTSIFLQSKV